MVHRSIGEAGSAPGMSRTVHPTYRDWPNHPEKMDMYRPPLCTAHCKGVIAGITKARTVSPVHVSCFSPWQLFPYPGLFSRDFGARELWINSLQTCLSAGLERYTCTYINARMHIYGTHMHACIHTGIQTYMHAFIQTYIRTYIHTDIISGRRW